MVLIWNSISSPSTSKIRVTVFIEGLPTPRSISFTVARLMPAISAKSIWEIPKTPRRSLTTSLRFIKVYYNQLFAAKINNICQISKKSLIKHTFGLKIIEFEWKNADFRAKCGLFYWVLCHLWGPGPKTYSWGQAPRLSLKGQV